MEDFKGTKGIWTAHPYVMCGNNEIHVQSEQKGRSFAIVPNHGVVDVANAQLIAAAPEMLEALLYFRDCYESWSDAHNDVKEKVEIAIAKALGKEADNKSEDKLVYLLTPMSLGE